MQKCTDMGVREVYCIKSKKHWCRILLSFCALVCTVFFISCDFLQVPEWGSPAHAWFDKYTNSAAVLEADIPDTIGKSNTGISCIESNEDKTITLFLRNPQNYTLLFEYVYDVEGIQTAADSFSNGCSFIQSEDKQSVSLIFSRAFLNAIDMGTVDQVDAEGNPTGAVEKNISGTIKISEAETLRTFEDYHLSLMVNSAPPVMRAAQLQRDRKKSEDDDAGSKTSQYVICFNIKNLYGSVHQKDTKDIYFGNEHYLIDFSSSTPTVTDAEGNATSRFLTSAPTLYNIDDGASTFSPTALNSEGYVALYYLTGVNPELSDSTVSFTMRMVDQYGFTTKTEVSNRNDKLVMPALSVNSLDNANGEYRADDDKGVFTVVLSHDGSSTHTDENGNQSDGEQASSAVTINYEVFTKDGIAVTSGRKKAPVSIPLEKGKYYIKAYASHAGFIDSDTQNGFGTDAMTAFTIHRSTNYYVNRTGYDTWNGSKNKPFRTIQKCISEIATSAQEDFISSGYSIILQSNITPSEDDNDNYLVVFNNGSVNGGSYISYTLEGKGYTIDAQASQDNRGGVVLIKDGVTVTFNDVNIKGSYCNSSLAGVMVDDSTLNFNSGSIKGCYGTALSVCNSNANVTLGSSSGGLVTISTNTSDEAFSTNGGPCAVYVGTDLRLRLYKAIIYDNFDTDGKQANLYLDGADTHAMITVLGNLKGSKIGVYTSNDSLSPSETDAFTENYGYLNGQNKNVAPGNYFIGDIYGVTYDAENGEAVLGSNGGGLKPVVNEEIKIIADSMYVPFNTTKDIHISVLKTEGENSLDVTSLCSNTSFAFYYYGDKIEPGSYYSANGNTFTAKNTLRSGEYTIYVSCVYNGRTYSAELPLKVRTVEEVYVDQAKGLDSNDGTRAHPVKTLKAAIDIVNRTDSFGFYSIYINGNVLSGGSATLTANIAGLTLTKNGSVASVNGESSPILTIKAPVDLTFENVSFTTSASNSLILEEEAAEAKINLIGATSLGNIKVTKGNTLVIANNYTAESQLKIYPADNDTTDRILISGNLSKTILESIVSSSDKWSIDREGRLAAPLKDAPDAVGDLVLKSGKAVAYDDRAKINSTQRADAIAVIFYDHNDEYSTVNQKLGDRLLGVGIGSFDGHTERYSAPSGTASAYGYFKWIDAINSAPCYADGNHSRTGSGISGDVDGSDNLAKIGEYLGATNDDTAQWHYNAIQWAMWSYPVRFEEEWRNGWYLPSSPEFLVFWWNRGKVNAVLAYAAPNLKKFDTADWFWTSTTPVGDSCSGSDATFFRWGDGKTNWQKSTNQHCVCAIRNFK